MPDVDPSVPTPPDEPLDDAARARIRHRITSGLEADDRPAAARRWLAPVAASIAVGALVVGGVALGNRGDDRGAGPAGPSTPSSSPSSAATTEPAPDLPVDATEVPTDVVTSGTTTTPTDDLPPVDTPGASPQTCDRETRTILRGAVADTSVEDEQGATTYYVSGDRYALCHDFGGAGLTQGVTVHHPQPLAGGGDRNPYELSTEFPDDASALLVAGGPVPDGDQDFKVTYTFADGHAESSALVGDPSGHLWWLVVYDAPDAGAATDGPPTVEVVGGPPATRLEITDLCAQANHGC